MKKSYKGFGLWILTFMVGFIPLFYLPVTSSGLTRLTLNYTCFMLAFLSYIIYRFDRVYWYNGVLFEEAEQAGRERRDAYALKHRKRFSRFAVAFALFSVTTHLADIGIWVDTVALTIGLIATAISTIKIKL